MLHLELSHHLHSLNVSEYIVPPLCQVCQHLLFSSSTIALTEELEKKH